MIHINVPSSAEVCHTESSSGALMSEEVVLEAQVALIQALLKACYIFFIFRQIAHNS